MKHSTRQSSSNNQRSRTPRARNNQVTSCSCGRGYGQQPSRHAPSAAYIRAFLTIALFALVALNNIAMWFFPTAREAFGMLHDILLVVVSFYFAHKVRDTASS